MDAKEALALVDKIYARLRNRRPDIDKFERYYGGDQALTFATDEWLKANGARYAEFSDNWCASITNAEAERIGVIGIKLRGEDPLKRDAATQKRASGLWDHWLSEQMEAQSSQGFLTSLNAKRSYVLVWGDDAQVTWEHPSNVEIEYDWMNPRVRKAALKTWVDEKTEFATLYTPEYLWKFERSRSGLSMMNAPQAVQMSQTGVGAVGAWKPREVAKEPWPLPNPMGVVPIVEIPNRPMLRGEPVSEIETVIPKQNGINLIWAYSFFAADYVSMPARVLLGATPPMRPVLDSEGNVVSKEPITMAQLNESRFAVFSGEHAKIDQWSPASVAEFMDMIDTLVGHIAAQTRTPPTYLVTKTGMSNVNGEGLKASEIGLVNKVGEFQTFATPALREVFSLIALAKGEDSLAEETKLATIVWKNPEIKSESQLADMITKKRAAGYPLEWLMEQEGIDPYDMARIKTMIKAEQKAALDFGVEQALNGDVEEPTADELAV